MIWAVKNEIWRACASCTYGPSRIDMAVWRTTPSQRRSATPAKKTVQGHFSTRSYVRPSSTKMSSMVTSPTTNTIASIFPDYPNLCRGDMSEHAPTRLTTLFCTHKMGVGKGTRHIPCTLTSMALFANWKHRRSGSLRSIAKGAATLAEAHVSRVVETA
jgi:hypothetical protein